MKENGLLVVGRYFWFDRIGPVADRHRPSLSGFAEEDVLAHYKGFEGDPWLHVADVGEPSPNGILMDVSQLEKARTFLELARSICRSDLLYLHNGSISELPAIIAEGFTFCGYEYGFFGSAHNYWACVVQEILLSRYADLRQFAAHLNENLLLKTIDDVLNYRDVRNRLSVAGADLETEEDTAGGFRPIRIYCLSE